MSDASLLMEATPCGAPKYAKVKKRLREKLYAWMDQQGDKGQATEMKAFEHQGKNRRNKNKKKNKKQR